MKIITILWIIIFPFQLWANTADVVTKGDGQISIHPNTLQHLGFSVNLSKEVEPPEIQVPPPVIRANQQPNPERKAQLQQALSEAEPVTPPDQEEEQGDKDDPNLNVNPSPTQQASTGSSQPFQMASTPTSSSGGTVINQVPYRDDEEEDRSQEPVEISKIDPLNSNPFVSSSPSSPDKKKKAATTSQSPLASNGSQGGFGDFQSSSSNNRGPNKSSNRGSGPQGAATQALSKLKGKRGYFGAQGSKSTSRRRSYKRSRRGYRKKGHRLSSNKRRRGSGKDPRALLQARLRRGLASAQELGDKNIFLFSSMCRHYDRYEKKNNINFGRTQCPKP